MRIEFRGDGFAAGGPVFLIPWSAEGITLPSAEGIETRVEALRAGHISQIRAEVTTAPGAGETLDFDIMISGSPAANTHADIDETATTGFPTTIPDTVAAGANIGLRVTRSAAAADPGKIRVSVELGG
jgi:hypothetical protein